MTNIFEGRINENGYRGRERQKKGYLEEIMSLKDKLAIKRRHEKTC